MDNRLRRIGTIAAPACSAVLLLLWSTACGSGNPPPADHRNWLVAPLSAEPESLNFVLASDGSAKRIGRLVADSLVDCDENLQIVPRLARSWTVSPDQKTITFQLRENVQWHDGEPFTAADVRFTYERIMDPASGPLSKRSQFREIERLETPDPFTVRVVYRKPYAPALIGWRTPIVARHVFGGGEFRTAAANRAPTGTGPYRFEHWKTDQEIVLAANDEYWGGPPAIRRVVFKIIPSKSTQYRALLAGEIDLAVLDPEHWQDLDDAPDTDRFRLLQYPSLWVAYIAWNGNGTHPAFSDARVRRALALLIDRRNYLDKVLLGFGQITATLFHPDLLAPDPGLEPLPYDPKEAARLLDEAGWQVPADGDIRFRNGTPLRFQLMISGGTDWQERFAAFLQESYRRAGIAVDIQRLDHPALLDHLRGGRFEAVINGFRLDLDPDPYPAVHSSQIGSGVNYVAYSNPDLDRLLESARERVDAGEREHLYRAIATILVRDQPFTFLWFRSVPLAIDSRFENVPVSPLGLFSCSPGILDWRIRPEPVAAAAR
jgi:peptide/nickel transport system substrate-binding protein